MSETIIEVPEIVAKANPSGGGDPHFSTWGGDKFSYHGACDMVLMSSEEFAEGLGLDVHIRTKHRTWYSFITNAAVRIGDEVLEVTDDPENPVYLNGQQDVSFPAYLSGFKVTSKRDNDKQVTYHIELGHGHENLVIRVLKDFVTVTIKRGTSTDFNGARGLMGSFPMGEKVGRDGHTVIDDADAFGQEWQVLRGEHHLFQNIVTPQHPQRCTPPPKRSTHHRRLGEQVVDREAAEKACEGVSEEDLEFCIFDVMATSDTDMAQAYVF